MLTYCTQPNPSPERIVIVIIPYRYKHLPIGGGGYVTGFIFHPADPTVMYSRTDIGGTYRFDYDAQRWISLIDHVTPLDLRESCPISAAVDGSRLYIAGGIWQPDSHGVFAVSEDQGATFRRYELPVYVHGNLHGRGAGERLLAEGGTLWLASQKDGLWRSCDGGETWNQVESFPETGCTFVSRIGRWLLVGTEGLAHRIGMYRLHRFHYSATRRSITIIREGEGKLDPREESATLALHALPLGALPSVVADGAPCPGAFNEQHVYLTEIPTYSNRVEITL